MCFETCNHCCCRNDVVVLDCGCVQDISLECVLLCTYYLAYHCTSRSVLTDFKSSFINQDLKKKRNDILLHVSEP